MKNTNILVRMALAVAVFAMVSSTAHAASVYYEFSNTIGNVSGAVTGHVDGLTDNSTSSASAVWVDSYPAGLVISGSYPTPFNVFDWTGTSLNENSFTLSGGVVTAAFFSIVNGNGDNDQLFLNSACACAGGTGHTNFLDIGSGDIQYVWSTGDLGAVDGLRFSDHPFTSAVPEPSSLISLFVGLALPGIALRSSRRKQASNA